MARWLRAGFCLLICSGASGTALACPDLTGSFACPGDGHTTPSTSTITQHVQNGSAVYSVTTIDNHGQVVQQGDHIADGVVRPEPAGPGGAIIPASYTCVGNTSLRMDASFTSSNVGQIVIVGFLGLDGNRNLHVTSDVHVPGQAPNHTEETCARR